MEKMLSSVSGLYKEMNPSHLSGANDVIVVETKDGRLKSSGFQAKFGKLHAFRTCYREVIVSVNGKVVDVETRLDEDGNVFFVSQATPKLSPAEASPPSTSFDLAAGFKSFKSFVDSTANYNFLLSHSDSIYNALLNDRYVFSECLSKPPDCQPLEVFRNHKVNDFTGDQGIVVGLLPAGSSEESIPEFIVSFSLFSELFFCARRTDPSTSECRNRSLTKYLIRQLLRRRARPRHAYPPPSKSLLLPEATLKRLGLVSGRNTIVYRLTGTPIALTAQIFLWRASDRIVVSDIDGTVTKSDVIGYIWGVIGRDWSHPGIVKLYNSISANGYRILYLSSRPIGHSGFTKTCLRRISQDRLMLPEGPILLFPGRLVAALYREMVIGPEEFKVAALGEIKRLFGESGGLFAGFGNKNSDKISYEMSGINPGRIFIVKPSGKISTGKRGLIEFSHAALSEIADGIFPPVSAQRPAASMSPEYIGDTWWFVPEPEEDA